MRAGDVLKRFKSETIKIKIIPYVGDRGEAGGKEKVDKEKMALEEDQQVDQLIEAEKTETGKVSSWLGTFH